jgi:hypothetical protein
VLQRETYQDQMKVVDEKRSEVRRKLISTRESEVRESSFEELDRLMERLGITIEPLWVGLYEQDIDLDAVIEQLRPHLEPAEVDIAAAAFQEAVDRAPGSGVPGALTDEEFHGIFMSSLTVLLSAQNPLPIASASKVIGLFPDKTRVVSEYLRKVASSYPREVLEAATDALKSGYLTGLQKAWLLAVLRGVAASSADVDLTPTRQIAGAIAEGEDESWLPRVEAVRLLADVGELGHELFNRIWNRAPAALRADLVAAVAIVARDPDVSWAVAFRDSLNPDPLMQVVLQGVDNATKMKEPVPDTAEGKDDAS